MPVFGTRKCENALDHGTPFKVHQNTISALSQCYDDKATELFCPRDFATQPVSFTLNMHTLVFFFYWGEHHHKNK